MDGGMHGANKLVMRPVVPDPSLGIGKYTNARAKASTELAVVHLRYLFKLFMPVGGEVPGITARPSASYDKL
jgi:hypothetical protein